MYFNGSYYESCYTWKIATDTFDFSLAIPHCWDNAGQINLTLQCWEDVGGKNRRYFQSITGSKYHIQPQICLHVFCAIPHRVKILSHFKQQMIHFPSKSPQQSEWLHCLGHNLPVDQLWFFWCLGHCQLPNLHGVGEACLLIQMFPGSMLRLHCDGDELGDLLLPPRFCLLGWWVICVLRTIALPIISQWDRLG